MENEFEPSASQIFLEIARSPKKKFIDTSLQYCEHCHERLEHEVMDHWNKLDEIYTCTRCRNTFTVRVR